MPKERNKRVSCRNRSREFVLDLHKFMLLKSLPGRQLDFSRSIRASHNARAQRKHNLNTQTQFNDLNRDCIGLIFSHLEEKEKHTFKKVCTRWEAIFNEFWKIVDIKVDVRVKKPSPRFEEITMTDFTKLLKIGCGHHLKSVTIYASVDETNSLIGQINAEDYIIIGDFDLYDFLKVIVDVSTNIDFFAFFALSLVPRNAQYISSLSAAISELISRNRKMRFYTMLINEPHAKLFKIKDLPHSIEDVSINFLVEDVPTILDWISVANNLRSLSFNATVLKQQQWPSIEVSSEYMSAKDYTSQMMKCVTYNDALRMKVLQLTVPKSSTLMKDVKSIADMKSLEELYITFPGMDVSIDDFLLALSSGCGNLKKLQLSKCTFSNRGINSILNELHLSHLYLDECFPQWRVFPMQQTTLRSLKLKDLNLTQCCFRKLLQIFKQLRHIEISHVRLVNEEIPHVRMVNEDIYALCAACPLLEEVKIVAEVSTITDEALHHMLTTLSKLTMVEFDIGNAVNFIPLHMENVHSNVRDVRLYYVNHGKNLAQLAKLHNMRSLSLLAPHRYFTSAEMKAICSGCKKLEEIHFMQKSSLQYLNSKMLEQRLNSLLHTKPSLQLVTIDRLPVSDAARGEKVTLKKQRWRTVRTAKHYLSYYVPMRPDWVFKHDLIE